MSYDPALTASAVVPPTADVAGLIRAAGGEPSWARYDAGTETLHIRGLSQEALDTALGGIDALFSARSVKKRQAQVERDRRIDAGMPFRDKIAQIDDASLARITSVSLGASLGLVPAIPWRMLDNTVLMLDSPGVIELATAALAYVAPLRERYWQLVDLIEQAPDQATLDAIDPSTGWPEPAEPAAPES